MSITAISSVQIANNGASFLQSVPSSPGGNWVQDTATADASATADWMDPNASSSGGDAVELAANAFAAAEQISMTNKNTIAVNTGISVLSTQLTGQSVNVVA
jgi:hypothetical protein